MCTGEISCCRNLHPSLKGSFNKCERSKLPIMIKSARDRYSRSPSPTPSHSSGHRIRRTECSRVISGRCATSVRRRHIRCGGTRCGGTMVQRHIGATAHRCGGTTVRGHNGAAALRCGGSPSERRHCVRRHFGAAAALRCGGGTTEGGNITMRRHFGVAAATTVLRQH